MFGRAKTVRIGKWRWPPPRDENGDASDSFLQFKLRQQSARRQQGGSGGGSGGSPRSGEGDGSQDGIDWDAYEFDEEEYSEEYRPHNAANGERGDSASREVRKLIGLIGSQTNSEPTDPCV